MQREAEHERGRRYIEKSEQAFRRDAARRRKGEPLPLYPRNRAAERKGERRGGDGKAERREQPARGAEPRRARENGVRRDYERERARSHRAEDEGRLRRGYDAPDARRVEPQRRIKPPAHRAAGNRGRAEVEADGVRDERNGGRPAPRQPAAALRDRERLVRREHRVIQRDREKRERRILRPGLRKGRAQLRQPHAHKLPVYRVNGEQKHRRAGKRQKLLRNPDRSLHPRRPAFVIVFQINYIARYETAASRKIARRRFVLCVLSENSRPAP